MTPTERKQHSERKLASLGIILTANLPPLESEQDINLKGGQQIAKRILILVYLNCIISDPGLREELMLFLIREKLWDEATSREKELFRKETLSEEEVVEIQWRSESIWLMLWSINKVKKIDLPKTTVNLEDIVELLPGFFEETSDFVASASIRDHTQILDYADFSFRLRWAIHEASNRHEVLSDMNESVAHERYIALNWIVGITQEWQG